MDSLNQKDPLTSGFEENVRFLIKELSENPQKSTDSLLTLIKEIIRQSSDEKLKIQMIMYLLEVETKRNTHKLQEQKEALENTMKEQVGDTDENLLQYQAIVKDLQAQIAKHQSDFELQQAHIEGLEKRRNIELRALKTAQYEINRDSQKHHSYKGSHHGSAAADSVKFSKSKFNHHHNDSKRNHGKFDNHSKFNQESHRKNQDASHFNESSGHLRHDSKRVYCQNGSYNSSQTKHFNKSG